jgi:hypothetical protein
MKSHKEVIVEARAERAESAAKSNLEGAEEKRVAQREKRAQSLAAMGLVTREGPRYLVTASARGWQESYEIKRDENGRVCCSCAEFERMSADARTFRCEHILAVKYSLAMNEEEKVENKEEMKAENQKEERDMTSEEKERAQFIRVESEPNPPDHSSQENQKQPQTAQVVPFAFVNLLRALRQPIDPWLIKTREGWTDRQGNVHWVEYIEWHTVADILDRVAPNWSHAVRNITQIGDMVAVTAAITIDGVTREGIGTGSAESETGIKKAEHDALKRAAVKFGIARELYRRESEVIEEDGAIAPNILRDPRPKTLGDLVTPKQLWMIRSLGRKIGCEVEQECQSLMQCGLEEISKRAASSFIDYLKRRQPENQPEELRRAS